MRIRNATKKDKKDISELYYELHPIEEKENKEKGLIRIQRKNKNKIRLASGLLHFFGTTSHICRS
ncbi:hypothetical protein J7K44_01610 [bacterium]|nr:hypothetical protein [bacterium]